MADLQPSGPQPAKTHQEALEEMGFVQLEEHEFRASHTWTLDTFTGYLYSTAAASKATFGDSVQAFEAELWSTLLALEPNGQFHETISFYYLLARRPDQP